MPWSLLQSCKASIYTLDPNTKIWTQNGTVSGTLSLYHNTDHKSDARIKFFKVSKEVWWRLDLTKIKPKGDKAWVLMAYNMQHTKEILAIRFSDQESTTQFQRHFNSIKSQQSSSSWISPQPSPPPPEPDIPAPVVVEPQPTRNIHSDRYVFIIRKYNIIKLKKLVSISV